MPGFLSDAEITDLWEVIDTGNATMQAFNRDPLTVTFSHMQGGAMVDGATVTLIRLDFGLREGARTGGAVDITEADGDLEMWATDPVPEVGDRFTWLGVPMRITKVYPASQGTVVAEVALLIGNR